MKFSVGEVAIWQGGGRCPNGEEVKILAVGPWCPGEGRHPVSGVGNEDYAEYIIETPSITGFCLETSLRKRPYKDQHTPAEQGFPELISSFKGVGV